MARQYLHWTRADVALLRYQAARGKTARQIAAMLGRTRKAVLCKASELGVDLGIWGGRPRYDDETVRDALRCVLAGESQRSIARRLGVSCSTVSYWLNRRAGAWTIGDVGGE